MSFFLLADVMVHFNLALDEFLLGNFARCPIAEIIFGLRLV